MKIIILENNVIDKDIVTTGTNIAKQQCATIGLPLQFDFKTTTTLFNTIPQTTEWGEKSAFPNPYQIQKETPTGYDVSILIYDWTKVNGIQPLHPVESLNSISIPIQWYVTYPEVLCEFILHELSHYFAIKNNKPDLTHFKYQNVSFNQKTNNEWYLFCINNILQSIPKIPTVTLTRNSDDGVQTLGTLTTDNFTCRTLERTWKNNQKNISCIPKGTYQVKWSFFPRLLSYHYQIMNVPNRSGIFFHAGNYFFDTAGCILVGNNPTDINKDKRLDILNSRVVLSAFESKMAKLPFVLVIQ